MRLLHSAFVLASCFALAAPAAGQLRAHRLDNGAVTVLASEAAGGRLLSFALAGQPNFLLVDEGAGCPPPLRTACAGPGHTGRGSARDREATAPCCGRVRD